MRKFNRQALTIMKDMYMGAHAPSTSRSAPSAPLRQSQIVTEKIKGSPCLAKLHSFIFWLPHANLCSVYMLMSIEFMQVYVCESMCASLCVQVYVYMDAGLWHQGWPNAALRAACGPQHALRSPSCSIYRLTLVALSVLAAGHPWYVSYHRTYRDQ